MRTFDVRPQSHLKRVCCDRCGRASDIDGLDHEFHEFVSISHTAGYGSIFGDGTSVEVDLCQYCMREVLGEWLRIKDQEE